MVGDAPGQPGQVVVGVAEPLVEHLEVGGADADGVLRRHADAAVQLDRLLADVPPGSRDGQPDPVGGVGHHVAVAAGDRHRRPVDHAVRELELDVHVGGPEGQRLEGVEGDAELLAALEVVRRRAHLALHHAERLVGAHDPGQVADRRDARGQVATRLTERRRGAAVERDAGGSGQVGSRVAGAGDRVGRDHEDTRPAVASGSAAVTTR